MGTLPLGSLLLVWDHLLRHAPAQGTPSTLNLQARSLGTSLLPGCSPRHVPAKPQPALFHAIAQVALALLQLLHPQLSRHLSERMEDVQAAYIRLAGMQLPDGDGSWLLQSALDVLHPTTCPVPPWRMPLPHPSVWHALQIDLNDTIVQEMRLQLRIGLLHRCRQSVIAPFHHDPHAPACSHGLLSPQALLPCMRPLPHVCMRMHVLRKQPNRRPLRRALTGPCRRARCARADNVAAPVATALMMLGVFAATCVLSANCASQRPTSAHVHAHEHAPTRRAAERLLASGPMLRSWSLARLDSSLMLLVLAMGAAVSACVRSWRRIMSASAVCCSMYVLAKAFAVLALGRSLQAGTCGNDCCNWVYCPCMRWWWLAVQGSAMSVAAAIMADLALPLI